MFHAYSHTFIGREREGEKTNKQVEIPILHAPMLPTDKRNRVGLCLMVRQVIVPGKESLDNVICPYRSHSQTPLSKQVKYTTLKFFGFEKKAQTPHTFIPKETTQAKASNTFPNATKKVKDATPTD